MIFIKVYSGALLFAGFLYLWFISNPEENFHDFVAEKFQLWYKYKLQQKSWNNTVLPEVRLSELEHRQRIMVVGFNDQGPICRKTLHKTDHAEFILTGYTCTEKMKIFKQVYEVQHCGAFTQLEYDPDRFIRLYTDPVPPKKILVYKTFEDEPIIRSI